MRGWANLGDVISPRNLKRLERLHRVTNSLDAAHGAGPPTCRS